MYDLGLTDSQLWAMTPRHYDALLQRFLDRQERDNKRFGLLAMLYANVHRKDGQKPFSLDDFAPSRHGLITPPNQMYISNRCRECGIHEGMGHLIDCQTGQSLMQYNLAAVKAIFTTPEDAARQLLGEAA